MFRSLICHLNPLPLIVFLIVEIGTMIIEVKKYKTIAAVQDDFNVLSLFEIRFLQEGKWKTWIFCREKFLKTIFLNAAGDGKEGELEVTDSMTVAQLEKSFRERFGMIVQVSRKWGTLA